MMREVAVLFTFFKSCIKLTVLIMLVWLLYYQIFITHPNKKIADRFEAMQYFDNLSTEEYVKENGLKYILIWSKRDEQLSKLKEGQGEFISSDCAYKNCFITKNINLLGNDYKEFEAIILNPKDKNNLPTNRSLDQTYIFATRESASKRPICSSIFDNYFNLTMSYRLDSDVPWPYFSIYNNAGEEVGPKRGMNWIKHMNSVDEETRNKLNIKQYAAVYVMCTCTVDFKKISIISNLQQELRKFYIDIKIIKTSRHKCTRDSLLRTVNLDQYYFYLLFEDPEEDHMSAGVLAAFNNYSVPVLFGKSDYSNFLPPHSYINAVSYKLSETALMMAYLIANSTAYSEFFKWRNHYTFHEETSSFCRLCETLNMGVQHTKEEFRSWWNVKDNSCGRAP